MSDATDPIITVNGKTLELKKAWPLKWKDIKTLRNVGMRLRADGADTDELEESEEVLRFILRRVDDSVDDADIDELTLDDVKNILTWINRKTKILDDVERPT